MRGPYLRARTWNDFGTTEPTRWRWPMMGSDGGVGGGRTLPFLVLKMLRDLKSRVKIMKAKEKEMM